MSQHSKSRDRAQTPPQKNSSLAEEDRKALHARGITDETIRLAGLESVWDVQTIARILNHDVSSYACMGGLTIPHNNLDGTRNCHHTFRPWHPRKGEGGKPIKYESPKGSNLRAYLPPHGVASCALLNDGHSSVFITEGPIKALALAQLGVAAVGVNGVWGGTDKSKGNALIDDLAQIPWDDRVVYIVFDYDPKPTTRDEVGAALRRLARALLDAGVHKVLSVSVPPGEGGGKNGIDDHLATIPLKSRRESLEALVGNARPVVTDSVQKVNSVNTFNLIAGGERGGIPADDPDPPVLGRAAYHGLVGDFLRAVGPLTEATEPAILGHLLPMIGTLIGPGPYIYKGRPQPPRLNVAIVGKTNDGRKGTAYHVAESLMEELAQKDTDLWPGLRLTGLATGEGLLARLADKREWDPETKTNEIIPTEKRLFVIEEEFGKILTLANREGHILSYILRRVFDSGSQASATKADPLEVEGAHVSIVGHITMSELRRKLTACDMENGFANRFLWFYVRSDKIIDDPDPIPLQLYQPIVKRVRGILPHNSKIQRRILFSSEATEKWREELYPSLRQDLPGLAGAVVARGSAIVPRLALLYSLLSPSVPKGPEVKTEHLEAAMAVWEYSRQSAETIFQTSTGTLLGDKILAVIGKHGSQANKDFYRHIPALITRARKMLTLHNAAAYCTQGCSK